MSNDAVDISGVLLKRLAETDLPSLTAKQLETVLTAKRALDVSFLLADSALKNQDVIAFSPAVNTITTILLLQSVIHNEQSSDRLKKVHRLISAIGKNEIGSEQHTLANIELENYLVDSGISKSVAKDNLSKIFNLKAHIDDFELNVMKQAQALMLEEIKKTNLNQAQLELLSSDEKIDANDFKVLFPDVNWLLLDVLKTEKTFYLFEPEVISLISLDLKNYAQGLIKNRKTMKHDLKALIGGADKIDDLLVLFEFSRACNANDNLTPGQKVEALKEKVLSLNDGLDERTLTDVLTDDPLILNKCIILRAANEINQALKERVISFAQSTPPALLALEKIIASKTVASFSQDILGVSMSEKSSPEISRSIKQFAARELIKHGCEMATSATVLAKANSGSDYEFFRALGVSESCALDITKNRLCSGHDLFTIKSDAVEKSKDMINDEVLNMPLNLVQLKSIIDVSTSSQIDYFKLFPLMDKELLSHFQNTNIFRYDTIKTLSMRLERNESMLTDIHQQIESQSTHDIIANIYGATLDIDKHMTFAYKKKVDILNANIENETPNIETVIKGIASEYAKTKLLKLPPIHQNDINKKINEGGNKEDIEKEYYDFYYKRGFELAKKYAFENDPGEELRPFLLASKPLNVSLEKVNECKKQINQLKLAENEAQLDEIKRQLIGLNSVLTKEALAFLSADEVSQINRSIEAKIHSDLEESVGSLLQETFSDNTLTLEQLSSVIHADTMNEIDPVFFPKTQGHLLFGTVSVSLKQDALIAMFDRIIDSMDSSHVLVELINIDIDIDMNTSASTVSDVLFNHGISQNVIDWSVNEKVLTSELLAIIQDLAISKAQETIKKQVMEEVISKRHIRLICGNSTKECAVYKKTFPFVDEHLFDALPPHLYFNDELQEHALNTLDRQTDFEMVIRTVLSSKQSAQVLKSLYLITDLPKSISSFGVQNGNGSLSDNVTLTAQEKTQQLMQQLSALYGRSVDELKMGMSEDSLMFVHTVVRGLIYKKINDSLLSRIPFLDPEMLELIINASSSKDLSEINVCNELMTLIDVRIADEVKQKAQNSLLEFSDVEACYTIGSSNKVLGLLNASVDNLEKTAGSSHTFESLDLAAIGHDAVDLSLSTVRTDGESPFSTDDDQPMIDEGSDKQAEYKSALEEHTNQSVGATFKK